MANGEGSDEALRHEPSPLIWLYTVCIGISFERVHYLAMYQIVLAKWKTIRSSLNLGLHCCSVVYVRLFRVKTITGFLPLSMSVEPQTINYFYSISLFRPLFSIFL